MTERALPTADWARAARPVLRGRSCLVKDAMFPCVALLLTMAPLRGAAEPTDDSPPSTERTRVPMLREKLAVALEQERKEQYREAVKTYLELIQSPLSTPEERWRWHMRTGWLYLLGDQSYKAERVFLRVLHPDQQTASHEITVVIGGESRIEKVRDPSQPDPPPGAVHGIRAQHWKHEATLGLARVYAGKGDHERAREWLDKADTLHPLACRLCDPMARVTHAALLQSYQAAAQKGGDLNVAFDQLHQLIDGKCWLPMQLKVDKEAAQEVMAQEAQLALAQLLLSIGDPGKAKTFLEQAATGKAFAAKMARAYLRKLGDVKKRPSERLPDAVADQPAMPGVALPLP